MRIAIGCDDTGFSLKEHVSAALETSGHDLLDLGTFSTDPVDHPDYARAVAQALLRGFVDAGVLICGSGVGASIAANKIRGIRASLCHDPDSARLAREEDDANVLCLGARDVTPARAVAIAMAWLGASFSGGERFARKISKIALLESGPRSAERPSTRPTNPVPSPDVPPPPASQAPGPIASPPVTSPPVTSPPVTSPPVTSPPVTSPPVTSPPVTSPRATSPPVAPPPVASPPATLPPANSPVTSPPFASPPLVSTPSAPPPVASPSVASPPVPSPPLVSPPVASPPVTSPPVAPPPVASPPATLPPATLPPAAPPPVASPFVASPPVASPPLASPPVAPRPVASPPLASPPAALPAAAPTPAPPRPGPTLMAAPAPAPIVQASRPVAPPMAAEPLARPLHDVRATTMVVEPRAAGMVGIEETYTAATAAPPSTMEEVSKLPAVQEMMDILEEQDFLDRLWVKDATLWRGEVPTIRHRLGWLTSPTIMKGHTDDLRSFADEIRRLQFSHVVLLGIGGAALAADVFNLIFGSKMGFPDLVLLDSTDPAAVKQTLQRLNLARTLFVVASKSGDTPETLAFYEYFRGQMEASSVPRAGIHFVAITDPGRPLDKIAAETGFRRTFLNPASIGARYSALSFFGLVPAALMGIDVKSVLDRAHAMVEACGNVVAARDNAAVRLGGALAGLAKAGRDKVTLVLSRKLRGLGPWIEQLLAESLGKDGRGIVPVDDEPLGSPVVYGEDRVFVAITLDGDDAAEPYLSALEEAGHPVIRIPVKDSLEVGAEFFRWELATAAAGVALGVNPFDEPDGARVRENISALLATWRKTRRLPEWPVDAEENGLALMTNTGTKSP